MGSQVLKPMENTLPLERQVGASLSGDGMIPMRICGDPMTGTESASRCSSDVVNLNSSKAIFSRFTSSSVEVTHGLGIQDSGFTGDMVISSAMAMAMIEPPILKEVPLILC